MALFSIRATRQGAFRQFPFAVTFLSRRQEIGIARVKALRQGINGRSLGSAKKNIEVRKKVWHRRVQLERVSFVRDPVTVQIDYGKTPRCVSSSFPELVAAKLAPDSRLHKLSQSFGVDTIRH